MSRLEGLSEYKDLSPATDIIMFTVFDDRQRIFEAICAEPSGYLLKSEPLEAHCRRGRGSLLLT